MLRLAILFTLASAAFSFMSFNRGGVLPGIVFAICAILPLGIVIASTVRTKRNGGRPAPISPLGKGVMGAVSIVLVAALAYSVYWTFWVPKPSKKDLKYAGDLSQVCGNAPSYFPKAAAHTGAGPHPIVVFTKSGTGSSLQQVNAPYDAPAGWNTRDVDQIQLVGCFDDVSSGDKIGECAYDKGSVPVYQGRYQGSIVEARTGKKVADVEISGNTEKYCPMITMVRGDAEDNKLHTKPEFAEIQRVLGSYVNG